MFSPSTFSFNRRETRITKLNTRPGRSPRWREQPPEREEVRSLTLPHDRGGSPMGGASTCVQLHFVRKRRFASTPHLSLYYLVSPWVARARSTSSSWRERSEAHCRTRVRDTRVSRAARARLLRAFVLASTDSFFALWTELSKSIRSRINKTDRQWRLPAKIRHVEKYVDRIWRGGQKCADANNFYFLRKVIWSVKELTT